MPSLLNIRQVKAYLLAHSPKGKTQVSKQCIERAARDFEFKVLKSILNHHDNKISKGKTLV